MGVQQASKCISPTVWYQEKAEIHRPDRYKMMAWGLCMVVLLRRGSHSEAGECVLRWGGGRWRIKVLCLQNPAKSITLRQNVATFSFYGDRYPKAGQGRRMKEGSPLRLADGVGY